MKIEILARKNFIEFIVLQIKQYSKYWPMNELVSKKSVKNSKVNILHLYWPPS